MNVGFVCVNYNNSIVTENLLDSITDSINSDNINIEVIIVDNSNNLILDLNKYPINIIIIKNENVGYFPGLNVGLNFLKTIRN